MYNRCTKCMLRFYFLYTSDWHLAKQSCAWMNVLPVFSCCNLFVCLYCRGKKKRWCVSCEFIQNIPETMRELSKQISHVHMAMPLCGGMPDNKRQHIFQHVLVQSEAVSEAWSSLKEPTFWHLTRRRFSSRPFISHTRKFQDYNTAPHDVKYTSWASFCTTRDVRHFAQPFFSPRILIILHSFLQWQWQG